MYICRYINFNIKYEYNITLTIDKVDKFV